MRRKESSDSSYRKRHVDSRGRSPRAIPPLPTGTLRGTAGEKAQVINEVERKTDGLTTTQVGVDLVAKPSLQPQSEKSEKERSSDETNEQAPNPSQVQPPSVLAAKPLIEAHDPQVVAKPPQPSLSVPVRNTSSGMASPQMPSPNPSVSTKQVLESRPTTPPEPAASAPQSAFDDEQIRVFEIPAYDSWYTMTPDVQAVFKHVSHRVRSLSFPLAFNHASKDGDFYHLLCQLLA